jgi:hypothetical protein
MDTGIVDAIYTYVTTRLDLYAPVYIDGLGEEVECLAMVHDPSVDNSTIYMDGSSEGVQTVSYLARSKNKAIAIDALQQIRALFNANRQTDIGEGYTIEDNRVMTLPSWIQTTEDGQATYGLSVNYTYSKEII